MGRQNRTLRLFSKASKIHIPSKRRRKIRNPLPRRRHSLPHGPIHVLPNSIPSTKLRRNSQRRTNKNPNSHSNINPRLNLRRNDIPRDILHKLRQRSRKNIRTTNHRRLRMGNAPLLHTPTNPNSNHLVHLRPNKNMASQKQRQRSSRSKIKNPKRFNK